MTGPHQKSAVFLARHAISGMRTTFSALAPNYAAGDAEFLDGQRPHDVQLRPLLASERTPNAVTPYPRGAYMLIYRSPTGEELRAIVRLPFRRRANTAVNARFANEQARRFNPTVGAMFDLALQGIDPFQRGQFAG